MPLDYRYEAVDAAGRRLNGTLTADSEKDARRKLFEQGLVVSKLQGEAKAKTNWDWRRLFQKRLSTSELILFTQQFRTLYMAGISLPEALRILHDQVGCGRHAASRAGGREPASGVFGQSQGFLVALLCHDRGGRKLGCASGSA